MRSGRPIVTKPAAGDAAEPERRASVEIHDRQQFELRFRYELAGVPRGGHYLVDVFFFVPRNVGINPANYSKETFYGDVTALIRLDAEPLPLEQLADAQDRRSPLFRLREVLAALGAPGRAPSTRGLDAHVRLYAYLCTEGIRAEMKRLRRRLRKAAAEAADPDARERFEKRLLSALDRMGEALHAFRRVRAAYAPFAEVTHRGLYDAFAAADEFMSLFLDEHLARFVARLGESAPLLDGRGSLARIRLHVSALARSEVEYRLQRGYLCFSQGDAHAGEYFTYRASLLKKMVHQALYLNPREAGGDRFVRNAVAGVGAALAAIWATVLATQIPPTTWGGLSSGTQLLLFAGAVGAYVMKDRIKAVTNEYLMQRLRSHDHRVHVQGESTGAIGLGDLRAVLEESMRFASPEGVPDAVRRLRYQERTVSLAGAGGEEVLHYRKRLQLDTPAGTNGVQEGYRMLDILRMNVRHFLVRLDDPLDEVAYFDAKEHAFRLVDLPKVYHVNVVVRLRREDAEKRGDEELHRLRLVLSQRGIERIDAVAALGPYAVDAAH